MSEVLNAPLGAETPKEFKRPRPYYEIWQSHEGIPAHDMFHVEDLTKVELVYWDRLGCDAAFVNLADPYISSAIVLELKPGQNTHPVKHMFETWIFVVRGRGETLVEHDGAKNVMVPWRSRSLFAPPLNTRYQHFNRGDTPARILMVTNAPLTMNLYHSDRFIFDNAFVFDDRYAGEQGHFNPTYEVLGHRYVRTNMVPDVRDFYLHDWKERGPGARTVFLCGMSDNTIGAHVSEFAPGTYKKAHRHGPGAHVIILQGQGYSLNWKEGEKPTRVDWRENSMFSPPDLWYHQHFNTGPDPARYLALKSKGAPEHPMRLGTQGPNADPESMKLHQIEYENEEPWIYDMFVEELKKNGVPVRQERPKYRK